MSVFNKGYFLRNKGLALLGAGCGTGLALLLGFGPRPFGWVLIWMVAGPFFTGRLWFTTRIGRIWWGAYGVMIACLLLIHAVRMPHPLAWISLVLCAGCGVITVCLRYNPPPPNMSSELPASKPSLSSLLRK